MALRFNDRDYENGSDHGYYQHIDLVDIINNFMVSETAEGMMLANTKQTLVEYHAQRGVQELTYDTLRSIKSIEWELDGSMSRLLPQDAVGIVGVYWTDDSGYKHLMTERRFSGNPLSPLTDQEGNFLYDQQGNHLYAETSDTLRNFDNRTQSIAADAFYNYYAGSFENDELYDRYYSYYGRRFGLEPEQANINGTYWYDEEAGVVYIDRSLNDQLLVVDYVSDGLGVDVNLIKVHKFAEEAIYNFIKYKLMMSKAGVQLYEKQLSKKEYYTSKKRAKHRLSQISPLEIYNAMLGKAKWIKH